MNDFRTYKSGDNIKLQLKVTIKEYNHRNCSCCSPDDYITKEIIEEFKILHIIKRDNDFIFIFQRSDVFEKYILSSEQYAAVLIDSFILDTHELDKFNYIKILNKDEEDKQKLEKINKLKQIVTDKLKSIELYKAEYSDLNKQIDALNEFPNSSAFKLISNRMNEINQYIINNKEVVDKTKLDLEQYVTV